MNIHELVPARGSSARRGCAPGVAVERDYDPSLPPLRIDRNQIIQAMLNLGRNALQAINPGNGKQWCAAAASCCERAR